MRFPLVVTALAATAVLALPASATFPGRNGGFLFEVVPPQLPGQGFGGGPVHLWSASPRGDTARDLGVVAGDEAQFIDAHYTPNGRQIVFMHEIDKPTNDSARYSLDVMNADGTGRRVLIRRPHMSQFAVRPDGKSVVFTAVDERANRSLYVTSIAHPRALLVSRSWPTGLFQWSKTGDMFVVDGPCTTGFCRVNPRTQDAQSIPLDRRNFEYIHRMPAISSDETRVAFYDPTGPEGARVYGMDGGFRRNIRGPYLCVGPFSPDGTQLALADYCGGTTVHVSVYDFRRHRVVRLAPRVPVPAGGSDRLLDWQPLGT